MLIAHGARPDIADKAGDTAEAYAKEWDNEECLRVLQEAMGRTRAATTASKADSLCDSRDSRSPSEDSDSEEGVRIILD